MLDAYIIDRIRRERERAREQERLPLQPEAPRIAPPSKRERDERPGDLGPGDHAPHERGSVIIDFQV